MKALGSQLLVEMYACDARVLDDVPTIERAMREAALASGATIVHEKFHRFSPHGVSGVVVIAESHLAIHTWPEHRYAAVDLFTCGDTIDQDRCFALLRERLGSERFSIVSVARGHTVAIGGAPPSLTGGGAPPSLEGPPAAKPAHEGPKPAPLPSRDAPAQGPYRPLHADIFRYDGSFVERFIDPSVAHVERGHVKGAVREVCEQVYQFRLFTPEFCKLLIEEAEHCDAWITVLEKTVEEHGALEGVDDLIEPDTTVSWERMPGMVEVYRQVIERHVRPVVETLWVTFKLQKWDIPAVRKFEPDVVKGMDLHYDAETVGMVGYLSDGFTGGGTHFPRWNTTVGRSGEVIVGSVVVYPGGVSHEHSALPISAGKRYMLANSLY